MSKQTAQSIDKSKKIGEEKVSQEEARDMEPETQEMDAEAISENSQESVEEASVEAAADQQELNEGEEIEEKVEEEKEEIDPLTDLQNKLKEQEDKYIRLLAELENFKRRSQQETRSKLRFAGQALALDIIPGLDNLERAIEHANEEENEQLAEFVKGIEMVQQTFYDAFSKNNIERQYPEKEPFNPNHHEAVGVVETDDVQPEHIAQVFQAGYIMHDRVIRPAMVQVAKKK